MELLNIKEYVEQRKQELKEKTHKRIKLGIIVGIAENDLANKLYIKNKIKDFGEMGWDCNVYKVKTDVSDAIKEAHRDKCTSVIVQLPLRPGLVFSPRMIPPILDCDGLNPASFCKPATPKGIVEYLKYCGFPFSGKNAVILGRSQIVGRPMAKLLLDQDMTVSVCHSKTPEDVKANLLYDADLVVCAVGKPHLLSRNDCQKAIVIDVGINRNEEGKLCGDFDEWSPFIGKRSTPVPGGVGLLTRLALLENCAILGRDE